MTDGPLSGVFRQLRCAAIQQEGWTDAQLLAAFIARRDEAAFAALVRRHGPMVWGVARRVVSNDAEAEDAFQATFLVLARKAASLRNRAALGNWLYGVAHHTALKAKAMIRRRRAKEKQFAERPRPEASEAVWQQLQPLLDQELSQLPDKYRMAIVLCDLEGCSIKETARQLGCPPGTVASRLARGRALLAQRLARHGLALSGGVIFAVLSQQAAACPPPSVVSSTIKAATLVAAGQAAATGAISVKVATLTEGVLRTMLLTKLKVASTVLLIVAALSGAAGLIYQTQAAEKPQALRATQKTDKEKQPAAKEGAGSDKQAKTARLDRERANKYLHQALEALGVADPNVRGLPHRALADVAVLQMNMGERAAATKTFERVRRAIDVMEEYNQCFELRLLARAYAQAGDAQAVLNIVQKDIPDNLTNKRGSGADFRDMILHEAAEALAKGGHERDALRLVDAIQKDTSRKWARHQVGVELALRQADARHFDEARRTIAAMDDPADRVMALAGVLYTNPTYSRFPEKPGLSLLLARAGQEKEAKQALAEAARLAEKMPESREKQRSLAAVVCVQARLGQIAAARQLLKGIVNEAWLNIATAAVAEELGAAGKAKEAQTLMDRLPNEAMKVHALYHIAAGQARAGDHKGATATFARAIVQAASLPQEEQLSQLHNIATAQAAAGHFKEARQTLRDHLKDGAVAWANVAHMLATADKMDEALQLVMDIPDDWWKANILRDVARQQAAKGQDRHALAWINKLSSPLLRGNALLGLAEGLAGRP